MMALGMAMDESGAGQALGGLVIEVAGAGGPGAILGLLMVLTVALSIPMSNQAAALVVLPIGLAAAANLGLSPRPFAIGITLAASCSLLTPLEPSAMMVFRPGNYRFADFLRVGGPLTAVLLLGLALLVPELWPFHDDDTGPITRAVLGSLPGKPPP